MTAPDGRTWRVRRKWLTRTAHWRGPLRPGAALDLADGADLFGLGAELPGIGVVLAAIAITLLLAGVLALVVPLLFLLGELFVVVVPALVLGAVARVVLRKPWIVEARVVGTNEGRQWKITGWRASGEQVETVAERLRSTGRVGDVTWTPSPTD